MTITFNRAQLITVAEAALAAHAKAQVDHTAKVAAWKEEQADTHRIKHRAQLVGLRDRLSLALRRNEVLTRAQARTAAGGINDIEHLFYTPPVIYDVERGVGSTPNYLSPAELIETRSLLSVLVAAEGDTITANDLKLLGFKNLQAVFTAASRDAQTPRIGTAKVTKAVQ